MAFLKDHPKSKKRALAAHAYTSEHAALFLGSLHQQARSDFSVFRRVIRPDMLWGWWTDEVARELQQFADDLIAGRGPATQYHGNAADCLTALQTDAAALQRAVAFEVAAEKRIAITRRRLRIGEINYLELLMRSRPTSVR